MKTRRKFNFWLLIGISGALSFIWRLKDYLSTSEGWISLILTGTVIILIILKGSMRQRICEEGIVSYDGVYTWRDIKNFIWLESLDTGKTKGISFEIDKEIKCKEINFFINEQDIESAINL